MTGNEYACICSTGWTGADCQIEVDPCSSGPCDNGGTCVRKERGGYECRCKPAWTGATCQLDQKPRCAVSTGERLSCGSASTAAECLQDDECCFDDSDERGPSCYRRAPDPCARNPCLNGGSCVADYRGSFKCECMPSYIGSRCQIYRDPCSVKPCQNGGKCFSTGATYWCECPVDFIGPDCETPGYQCGMRSSNSGHRQLSAHSTHSETHKRP